MSFRTPDPVKVQNAGPIGALSVMRAQELKDSRIGLVLMQDRCRIRFPRIPRVATLATAAAALRDGDTDTNSIVLTENRDKDTTTMIFKIAEDLLRVDGMQVVVASSNDNTICRLKILRSKLHLSKRGRFVILRTGDNHFKPKLNRILRLYQEEGQSAHVELIGEDVEKEVRQVENNDADAKFDEGNEEKEESSSEIAEAHDFEVPDNENRELDDHDTYERRQENAVLKYGFDMATNEINLDEWIMDVSEEGSEDDDLDAKETVANFPTDAHDEANDDDSVEQFPYRKRKRHDEVENGVEILPADPGMVAEEEKSPPPSPKKARTIVQSFFDTVKSAICKMFN